MISAFLDHVALLVADLQSALLAIEQYGFEIGIEQTFEGEGTRGKLSC